MLLSGLVVAAACMRSSQPTTAGGTLSPMGERAGAPEEGAFRVVFAAPQGEASRASELSLVFSRPLRGLDVEAPPPPITLQPAIAGKWLWVGSRALRFVPEVAALPNATEFTVEVPGTVTALDGTRLGEPYRFSFRTERPKLVNSEPGDGAQGLRPNDKFTLYFNQAVDPLQVERHGKLTAKRQGKAQTLAFRARRPDPRAPKRVELRPAQALPLDSEISLVIAPELTGEEGKLTAGEASVLKAATYGPLRVEELGCNESELQQRSCQPGSSLSLRFNNRVRWSDFRKALRVTPEVPLRWAEWQQGDELTEWASLSGNFKAATTYTVAIDQSLRDEHGQTLAKGFTQSKSFGDYLPELEIGIDGEALEPTRVKNIPVGYRNVPSFELVKAKLDAELVRKLPEEHSPDVFEILRKMPAASYEKVQSAAAKNQVGRREIDPLGLLGGSGRGVFALAVRYGDQRRRAEPLVQRQIVKLSDLALSAKFSVHGSLLWVTKLSTGSAVPGATVELHPTQGAKRSYQTDSSGLVRIPSSDYTPRLSDYDSSDQSLVFVRSGSDWTFERVRDHLSPWRVSVPVDLSGRLDTYGLVFTERGIYRPGDEVAIKGIVRDETPTGNGVPRGRSYELTFVSSEDEELGKHTVTTSEFGTFSSKFRIPQAGKLGTYRVTARASGKTGELGTYFEVAEYRPAEFEVLVEARAREVTRGAPGHFVVRGDYLYGAPMAGAKVTYNFAREPAQVTLPGHDAFVTDARAFYADLSDSPLGGGGLRDGQGVLAADGSLELTEAFDLPGQRFAERVALGVEVTDATRQAVGAHGSVLVHPADFYLGLKAPEDYFFTAPTSVKVDVVALTHSGQRLAGKAVALELVKRRWTLSRQDLGDGDTHAVSKPVDEVVSRCSLTTRAAPTSCELKVQEGGYFLVVARSADARKRAVETAVGLYGIGTGSFSWGDNDRAQLELVPNKKRYRVGETARILIKSPYPQAEALVTVERAGVYRAERIKLRGATPTVDVPVTAELAPNAFVGVHLVVPRPAGKEGELGPSYRQGYAEIPIDPEARRLTVSVKPVKSDLLPGQEAELDLAVTDRGGKGAPAELAVYAVDEGVLMLTGYRTPDPLPVFGATRALQVATLETREHLAKIRLSGFNALGDDKGADGGGGGGLGGVRRDFRQVALFEPKLLTDAQGRAKVRFKLPDTLTAYRVMAVAVGRDDRYGFGDSRITASKPLMVRPALPRFLRAGDAFEVAAVISAKGVAPGKVTVKAEITGGVLEGSATRALTLGKDASAEVRFPVRAERVGSLKIALSAIGGSARDSALLERRVHVPAAPSTTAIYGETKESVAEKLGKLEALRSDVGGVEVIMASSALIGIDSGLEDLAEYPYGCTEQLSSRLLPLGPLHDLAKAFALPLPKNVAVVRDRTVAQILSRQRGDGGFGMWPESPDTSDWVTPYTLWVLEQTRKSGAPVPKRAIEQGREYLRRWLAQHVDDRPESAAFAVDVLATLGTPDPGYADKLWQRRKELPTFARGLLLHALAVTKSKDRKPAEELARELENSIRISGNSAKYVDNEGDEYAALMDSPTRTTAIVLRGLLAHEPGHALASRLARGLLTARERGHWRSTQETAFSLVALDAYRRAQERAAPDFQANASYGERSIVSLSARGAGLHAGRGEVGMAALMNQGGSVVLEKEGSGTLFYELRLKYAPRTLPSKPLDAGFFVKKTLRAVKPAELAGALTSIPESGVTRFAPGDLVVADLIVVAPSPSDYVVVDDPLPAGFEAIDTNLATTAAYLREASQPERGYDPDARDDVAHGRAYLEVWHRQELRDDRALFFVDHLPAGMVHFRYLARATTLGSFVVPPTKAEEMYEPETFGRTAALLVEVR